jgi:phenylacetate-CoA ligase
MSRLFKFQCWLRQFYRRGPRYRHYSKMLLNTYRFSASELEDFQNRQLRKMVFHCYQNIPYYQETFVRLGLRPEDIQTKSDLGKLPIIDKKTVQADIERFISKKHRNFLCNTGTTSGSTGMPGQFVRDFDAINFEHAIVWRHWKNAGDHGKRRVSLRGDIIVPSSQIRPPFWRYNPANRELQMSSYHLSRDNSIHYIRKILEFKPEVLYCGPSMGHVLAKFFRHHQVNYRFDAVFTSSESLEPEVRQYIEEVFQCRIYDWYGQAERVAAIGQCRHGSYHIQEDYSIVELLPGKEDGSFELVGTQLHNYVMPLLRYRTQDFIYMSPIAISSQSCSCGSSFRMVDRILGRTYGYLLTPEGYHIAITAHIPVGVDNVIETQFYQEKQGEVVLKVLTNGSFTEADREQLVTNTLNHTSPHMKVFVEEVSEIPRGPNGKFINIINKMPISLN